MARVTVEDCIDKVTNRFELVMVAAQRARKIGSGAALQVERDNDKNTVVSLREIASSKVAVPDLKEELVKSHQRIMAYDDDEADIDLMDGEEEWNAMASRPKEEGMYADDEIEEDDSNDEPSLEDLAGA